MNARRSSLGTRRPGCSSHIQGVPDQIDIGIICAGEGTMLRKLLRVMVLAPLIVALVSCGGGDDEDTPRHEVPGFIEIYEPDPGFSTTNATVTVKGTGNSTVHTISWNNSAGGNGRGTVGSCLLFPFPLPLPCWQASIPLSIGTNVITVIGDGSEGRFGRATITITRT